MFLVSYLSLSSMSALGDPIKTFLSAFQALNFVYLFLQCLENVLNIHSYFEISSMNNAWYQTLLCFGGHIGCEAVLSSGSYWCTIAQFERFFFWWWVIWSSPFEKVVITVHDCSGLWPKSNTRKSVSSGFPNPEKRAADTTRSGVFLAKFETTPEGENRQNPC